MKTYKYSELERDIQDVMNSDRVDKYYLYSQMIAEVTENDDSCTRLSRKVLKSDIENMLEKIKSIFQRAHADCKNTENMSEIEQLIS